MNSLLAYLHQHNDALVVFLAFGVLFLLGYVIYLEIKLGKLK